MLVVDCCIRGEESATRKYYRAYLEKAGIPAEEITVLDLSGEEVASLDADGLKRRDDLCARKAFDDAMFAFARQFRDAEEILIAARSGICHSRRFSNPIWSRCASRD